MKKLLLLLTLTATFLLSASFDCQKATTDIEKLICSDEELSRLDDELGKAYKSVLNETDNSNIFKQKQKKWLTERNRCKDANCIKYQYEQQLSYLQYNSFTLIYSEDNKTCNQFANLLNNDLKKYNEINLSRHEEFNWIKWKQIQKEVYYEKHFYWDYNIFVDYFDINNNGSKEGVFLWESAPRFRFVDIIYTTRKDGENIEKLILSKEHKGWSLYNSKISEITENAMSETFSFYKPPLNVKSIERIWGSILFPEPYPAKFNNKYFIAVFGVKDNRERYIKYRAPLYSMPNCGNKVTLIKFNPDNNKEGICILEKVQSDAQQYLSCAKK
jgi:uncharacterized protein YecT (DUF1311 family)